MKKMDFSDLRNKVCVITGGAGVIGQALCEALAAAGIKTAIIDLNLESAQKMARALTKKYGTLCMGVQANVLDKPSLIAAREPNSERTGENRLPDQRSRWQLSRRYHQN